MDKQKFDSITKTIIDRFEGGYYHPNMNISAMGKSGETMFGIDRVHGGDSLNKSAKGTEFWSLIDSANASTTWRHGYTGGALKDRLKQLVVDMMYPLYESWSTKYLTTKAKQIVDSSERLAFHFCYAIWNGIGWFRKFANDINDSVTKGTTNVNDLVNVALASRKDEGLKKGSPPNAIVQKSGNTMEDIFKYMTDKASVVKKKITENIFVVASLTMVIVVASYLLYKVLIKKK